MEIDEYRKTDIIEDDHWWFVALRELLRDLITKHRAGMSTERCLDCGCGTGANLRLLRELYPGAQLAGFDCADEALSRAVVKCPSAALFRDDIRNPQQAAGAWDLLLCSDVLYTTGFREAHHGLTRIIESMPPSATAVFHFPAYQWLQSYHDRAVHTRERTTLRRARRYLDSLGLVTERISYRVTLLFPPLAAVRLVSGLRRGRASCSDLILPHPLINRWLLRICRMENHAIVRGCNLPMGSSIIAITRKHSAVSS